MPPTTENFSHPLENTAPTGSFDNFLTELHNQSQLTKKDVQELRAKEQTTGPTNSDTKSLPPLVVHDDSPHPKLSPSKQEHQTKINLGNALVDTVLAAGAVIAAEAVTGYLFKNPALGATAVRAAEGTGKLAPVISSVGKMAIHGASYGAAWGTATVARHYGSELVTGKPENWEDSANHAAYGMGAYMSGVRASRIIGKFIK